MALMKKVSAGLLMFRRREKLEVFLIHPGGPFWRNRDAGSWSIPKGALTPGETALQAAIREFREETGFEPAAPYIELGTIRQRGGKEVTAWAFEGDCDPEQLQSNTTTLEWPPRSGRMITVPEVEKGEWFDLSEGSRRINVAQVELLERLERALAGSE